MKKANIILWAVLNAGLLLAGGLALLLFLLPFPAARSMVDSLARDHHMQRFSAEFYAGARLPALILGILAFLSGIASLAFARRAQGYLATLGRVSKKAALRLAADFVVLFKSIPRLSPWLALAVVGLTLAALLARLPFLSRPMQHDESYTFVTFASAPLKEALTDYNLPNNHLFHTLLVHVSYVLFGDAPWAVRLPALLAGILIVPAAYGLARRLYNPHSAILVAALAAVAPVLISYSTNARGYTILAVLTLLTWSLGTYLRRQANAAAWLLLGILGALGFYTVPVFLNPYGILFTWLFLSVLIGDTGPAYRSRWHFLGWMFASGMVTVVLTILLYLPVFSVSGLHAVFGNSFVESLSFSDFQQTFPGRMLETWQEWNQGVSPILAVCLVAGLALSLVLHRRISAVRVPTQLAAVAWLAPVLLIQRPNPWPKIWLALMPVVLIWCSAGWMAPWLLSRRGRGRPGDRLAAGAAWAAGLSVAIILAAGTVYCLTAGPLAAQTGPVEQSVQYLQSHLVTGDVVVVSPPDDAVTWYYWRYYKLPEIYLQPKNQRFQRAYVLINLPFEQTVEQVIRERGPDIGFVRLETARLVQSFGADDLYEVAPDNAALDKVFGAQ
jgi:4-amino-4-deoxy-L-arabinose transferase-like glycosyltransferase